MESRYRWVIVASGLVIVGLSTYVALLGDLSRTTSTFLVTFAVMYVAYGVSVYLLSRLQTTRRSTLGLVFAVAVAGRLAGVGASPSLSDDVYRYMWEGRVVRAGLNPFVHAPDAAELAFLRDANYERINHKHLATIYPPVAQGAFYVGALTDLGVVSQKIVFALFDLGTMLLVALLLRARGANPGLCAVYGWSPLVIVEFAHSGHMDSLPIFFLVLAVWFFQKRHHLLGFVSTSLSFLAKYFAIALIPFFVVKRRYLAWTAFFIVLSLAGYLPFAEAPGKLADSLQAYGWNWHFNSLSFEIARRVVDDLHRMRLVLAGLLLAFAVYQGYRTSDLLRYTFLTLGCALLLSPTVYPWYVCWIIPFVCFYPSRAWLYLSGSIVLSYTVWPRFHAGGEWQVGWGVLLVEYVPFLVLLLYDGYRDRTSRQRARP